MHTLSLSYLRILSFMLVIFFLPYHAGLAQTTQADLAVMETRFATVYYKDEVDVRNFFWRISGRRFRFTDDIAIATSRVDMLVTRVQSILDMRPAGFHIAVLVKPQYTTGFIASYTHSTRTITVCADRVTDGIFAHEIAHAVIMQYFLVPPPATTQEILAQYVDTHLWEEWHN